MAATNPPARDGDGLGRDVSNTVLLGIPLVKLSFGDAGLVILLMLISLHSLILYSTATLFLEFGDVAAGRQGEAASRSRARMWESVRNTVMSPVILPIILGLVWGLFRWPFPIPSMPRSHCSAALPGHAASCCWARRSRTSD